MDNKQEPESSSDELMDLFDETMNELFEKRDADGAIVLELENEERKKKQAAAIEFWKEIFAESDPFTEITTPVLEDNTKPIPETPKHFWSQLEETHKIEKGEKNVEAKIMENKAVPHKILTQTREQKQISSLNNDAKTDMKQKSDIVHKKIKPHDVINQNNQEILPLNQGAEKNKTVKKKRNRFQKFKAVIDEWAVFVDEVLKEQEFAIQHPKYETEAVNTEDEKHIQLAKCVEEDYQREQMELDNLDAVAEIIAAEEISIEEVLEQVDIIQQKKKTLYRNYAKRKLLSKRRQEAKAAYFRILSPILENSNLPILKIDKRVQTDNNMVSTSTEKNMREPIYYIKQYENGTSVLIMCDEDNTLQNGTAEKHSATQSVTKKIKSDTKKTNRDILGKTININLPSLKTDTKELPDNIRRILNKYNKIDIKKDSGTENKILKSDDTTPQNIQKSMPNAGQDKNNINTKMIDDTAVPHKILLQTQEHTDNPIPYNQGTKDYQADTENLMKILKEQEAVLNEWAVLIDDVQKKQNLMMQQQKYEDSKQCNEESSVKTTKTNKVTLKIDTEKNISGTQIDKTQNKSDKMKKKMDKPNKTHSSLNNDAKEKLIDEVQIDKTKNKSDNKKKKMDKPNKTQSSLNNDVKEKLIDEVQIDKTQNKFANKKKKMDKPNNNQSSLNNDAKEKLIDEVRIDKTQNKSNNTKKKMDKPNKTYSSLNNDAKEKLIDEVQIDKTKNKSDNKKKKINKPNKTHSSSNNYEKEKLIDDVQIDKTQNKSDKTKNKMDKPNKTQSSLNNDAKEKLICTPKSTEMVTIKMDIEQKFNIVDEILKTYNANLNSQEIREIAENERKHLEAELIHKKSVPNKKLTQTHEHTAYTPITYNQTAEERKQIYDENRIEKEVGDKKRARLEKENVTTRDKVANEKHVQLAEKNNQREQIEVKNLAVVADRLAPEIGTNKLKKMTLDKNFNKRKLIAEKRMETTRSYLPPIFEEPFNEENEEMDKKEEVEFKKLDVVTDTRAEELISTDEASEQIDTTMQLKQEEFKSWKKMKVEKKERITTKRAVCTTTFYKTNPKKMKAEPKTIHLTTSSGNSTENDVKNDDAQKGYVKQTERDTRYLSPEELQNSSLPSSNNDNYENNTSIKKKRNRKKNKAKPKTMDLTAYSENTSEKTLIINFPASNKDEESSSNSVLRKKIDKDDNKNAFSLISTSKDKTASKTLDTHFSNSQNDKKEVKAGNVVNENLHKSKENTAYLIPSSGNTLNKTLIVNVPKFENESGSSYFQQSEDGRMVVVTCNIDSTSKTTEINKPVTHTDQAESKSNITQKNVKDIADKPLNIHHSSLRNDSKEKSDNNKKTKEINSIQSLKKHEDGRIVLITRKTTESDMPTFQAETKNISHTQYNTTENKSDNAQTTKYLLGETMNTNISSLNNDTTKTKPDNMQQNEIKQNTSKTDTEENKPNNNTKNKNKRGKRRNYKKEK